VWLRCLLKNEKCPKGKMGQIPSSAYTVGNNIGSVTLSTRSEPLPGYMVGQELGLTFANSLTYNVRDTQLGQQRLNEAMGLLAAEAQRLGANGVLGMHVEFKEIGQAFAVAAVYGTAVRIVPKQ
jgi:hypothetical protein